MLVWAGVLRCRGLGQCDLVRLIRSPLLLEIHEVKGARGEWGPAQRARLRGSAVFLAALLEAPARLSVGQ